MATLGKVLAVFNVLAAIGFLTLAGMDYNKRQGWAYSYFRHQTAVNGLPVDAKDDSWRLPGRTITDAMGKDGRAELFKGVGGPAVATQEEEVQQVVAAFKNGVEQGADVPAKRNVIATHLLPELKRADERDAVIHELQTLRDQAVVDALVARFDDLSKRATNPQADRETRRRSIADFLYNFEYTANWHTRVQAVVGLEQYVAAADRQYAQLRDVVARDRRAISEEQAAFVAQYQAIPPQLTVLANQFKALEGKLTEQKDLVQKHQALRNARKTDVMNLQNQIAAERQKAAEEFAALLAVQKELFAVQQDVAQAQAKNQELEGQLRARETGR
jgi:hypothetical protein